jgi:hypothetical protein
MSTGPPTQERWIFVRTIKLWVPVKWETKQKQNTAKRKETQRNETKHDETKQKL